MRSFKALLKRLFHIEDTPERTALAYSIGVFLGFSPFLGFHTLGGIAVAFLFGLNRIAVLLGVWSNTPWWIVPYYGVATWLGMWLTGFQFERESLEEMFRLGMEKGFLRSDFWGYLTSQWGFLISFVTGSLILATLLSLALYPLSLKGIKVYRSRRKEDILPH
jgi:uncharacterized protein (DUF2062 family)